MSYIDDVLQHELEMARFATEQVNSVLAPALGVTYERIVSILARYDDINSRSQLNQITAEIRQAIESNSGWDEVTRQLNLFAQAEPEVMRDIINQHAEQEFQLPQAAAVTAAIAETPMTLESGQRVQAGLWPQFVQQNIESRSQLIDSIVVNGFDKGSTIQEIRSQIQQSVDGVLMREAESLARTGTNHFGNIGRKSLYFANADIVERIAAVVTFDSRTTLTCRSISGKTWEIDDPTIPWAPIHWGCRTVFVPLFEGEETFDGTRASRGAGSKKGTFRGKQIPADKSHAAWLREQPEWFVRDSLGDKRADLFLDGGLSLDKFTDMSFRPLTLEQLQQRYPSAFRKAGIDA